MTNQPGALTNWTQRISDLSEDDRKSTEEIVRSLPHVFRLCELRLQRYGAGEDTVLKTLIDMEIARREIGEAQSDLIKKHELPGLPFPQSVKGV